MITCKGKSEILKMERATRIVQETLSECIAACRAGRDDRGDRPDRGRAASRRAAARPRSRATAATRRRSASRSTTRSSTGSRRRSACSKPGDVVGLDLGRRRRRLLRGRRAHGRASSAVAAPVRELVEHDPRGAPRRHRGRASSAGASATSARRSRPSRRAGSYGVVREFVGHGIGTALHEEPQVPNYGPPGKREIDPRGDDARDRADVQPRGAPRSRPTPTAGRCARRTAARRRISSTRSWRRPQGPVVLGFGRFSAGSAQTGAPGLHEYPLPVGRS